ncbi:MAG: HAMP domain-containing histidine kinase [Clostridioides sp.]|jgi:signal transduction histidine kinase|nr:HAMP domain-containing histidine kinase [Clostridioides sp.]
MKINKNIFTQTRKKLIKMYVSTVGGFLIIPTLLIYIFFTTTLYNNVDSEINSEFQNISQQLDASSYFRPITIKDPKDMVFVYDGDRIKYFTKNEYFDTLVPRISNNKIGKFTNYTNEGHIFRCVSQYKGDLLIQIVRNIDSEVYSKRRLLYTLSIAIIISLIGIYFVALYLTKKVLVPIENVWKNQADFIQEASHELRTPISIISSKLENMLRNPDKTINEEIEKIAVSMSEIRKMNKMVNGLLDLSKADVINDINVEKVDLISLLREVHESYEDISMIQEKKFEFICSEEVFEVDTDQDKLKQLILILISNAFKYTSRGDSIKIILERNLDKAVISISDTGCGIKKEDLNKIFDRFFRSEEVRANHIEGSGIGLSIAKLIAMNLSIKIKVKSDVGEGTTFSLMI